MKALFKKLVTVLLILFVSASLYAQKFQGQAYYYKKTTMQLGNWGAKMSEQQKKQIAERLKNRLEKTYMLTFSQEESIYKEMDKLDALSGATDSWGQNFTPGILYRNVKTNTLVQNQEFYGKQFLVKDTLHPFEWQMGSESKTIGNYTCFKATAKIPSSRLEWWSFSWDRISENSSKTSEETNDMTEVTAWYSPQIPVGHGPLEYWGLPGLILEVTAGNTVILCSKIILNPEEKTKIEAPEKGKVVTKKEYTETIISKMKEFRENRSGRRPNR
jgi:GLPGLI family protein